MISFVRGQVAEIAESSVVIDVGGVGYLVYVPTPLAATLELFAEDVRIHTSMISSDDTISLYGFATPEDRDIFQLLLSVSGIGPKAAIKLLSMQRERLTDAIAGEDVAVLTTVPGVGPKTAKRVILELKDKVGKLYGGGRGYVPMPGAASGGEAEAAVQGLQALGYSVSEIRHMMKALGDDELKNRSASELIGLCLKQKQSE